MSISLRIWGAQCVESRERSESHVCPLARNQPYIGVLGLSQNSPHPPNYHVYDTHAHAHMVTIVTSIFDIVVGCAKCALQSGVPEGDTHIAT